MALCTLESPSVRYNRNAIDSTMQNYLGHSLIAAFPNDTFERKLNGILNLYSLNFDFGSDIPIGLIPHFQCGDDTQELQLNEYCGFLEDNNPLDNTIYILVCQYLQIEMISESMTLGIIFYLFLGELFIWGSRGKNSIATAEGVLGLAILCSAWEGSKDLACGKCQVGV